MHADKPQSNKPCPNACKYHKKRLDYSILQFQTFSQVYGQISTFFCNPYIYKCFDTFTLPKGYVEEYTTLPMLNYTSGVFAGGY